MPVPGNVVQAHFGSRSGFDYLSKDEYEARHSSFRASDYFHAADCVVHKVLTGEQSYVRFKMKHAGSFLVRRLWLILFFLIQFHSIFAYSFHLSSPLSGILRYNPKYNVDPNCKHHRGSAVLSSLRGNKNGEPEYSRDILLREEAESPFRKIRFFTYASLGIAAATSLLISSTRILAGLNGINADLMNESLLNAGVDLGGIIVLAFLYQQDAKAQESRLKRAAKGAELAKLKVRVSKSMMQDTPSDVVPAKDARFTTPLASLRRGRGMEKRVVIAVGSSDCIQRIIKQAIELQDELALSDLLIVPTVITPPSGIIAPIGNIDIESLPECIALPVSDVGAGSWKVVIDDELKEATNQGINAFDEGFCVILKKNGRVGQRTRGIYLANMVGEVTQRRDAGMDVVNI